MQEFPVPVGGRGNAVSKAVSRHNPPGEPPHALNDEGQPAIPLLGPVQAVFGGRPVVFPSPKARALFALLALNAGQAVSVARLVGGLWGDDPPDTATATLQAYVSRLRRTLEQAAGHPESRPSLRTVRIRRQPPGYLLEVPDEAVDARLFRGLSAAAKERLDSDPATAVELLGRALALVDGEPLSDVSEQLQSTGATEAMRLAEQVLDARERQIDALLRVDDAETALLRSRDLLGEHPLRESAQALHLLALYRCGRQAEALSAYERFRRRLGEELGVDPGPQLRRLHTMVLRQDPALELSPGRRAAVTKTTRPGWVAQEPRDASIGREVPLGRLESALAAAEEGQGSVCLVTGEAGIGKTTLCQDLALRAQRRSFVSAWGRGRVCRRHAVLAVDPGVGGAPRAGRQHRGRRDPGCRTRHGRDGVTALVPHPPA